MIFVNRPYLFTVDRAGQLGSKIELFIWNGDTPPTNPNYTFTKQIASATDTANYYNISPFLAEFIQFGVTDTDSATLLEDNYFVNYRIKNYYLDEFGDYQPLFIGTPPTNQAMYGDFGNVFYGGLLKEDTYYTLGGCDLNSCDTISVTYTLEGGEPVTVEVESSTTSGGKNQYYITIEELVFTIYWGSNNLGNLSWIFIYDLDGGTEEVAYLTEDTQCPFGTYNVVNLGSSGLIFEAFEVAPSGVTNKFLFPLITNATNKTIRWTDLYNNTTETEVLTANKLYSINGAKYANGTKVEFLNNFSGVVNTWIFLPKCECTYEPIKVQYLNTYGALITTWFYKANKKEFSMENSEFKRFQTVDSNFYVGKQRQTFNTLAREKITVNSDWVLESYSQVIKDIITSEYTLVNDQFANVDTKSIEIQQNINNGLINYQLTFTYSNDYRR
jgi:hypothetical protein